VGVEYQSLKHHSLAHERARDRARIHAAEPYGWRVIELGIDDVEQRPHSVYQTINGALARARLLAG
jgi:hypothetical protein